MGATIGPEAIRALREAGPCVVRRADGKFLARGTGQRRGWCFDLIDADVFRTLGKAKIAYNHATAYARQQNRYYATRLKNGWDMGGMKLVDIPAFETVPAAVVLV